MDPPKKGGKEQNIQAPPTLMKSLTKPQDPLFKIKFNFKKDHEIKEKVEEFDEDDNPQLDEFDLNFWDGRKIRRFPNPESMIETMPKE